MPTEAAPWEDARLQVQKLQDRLPDRVGAGTAVGSAGIIATLGLLARRNPALFGKAVAEQAKKKGIGLALRRTDRLYGVPSKRRLRSVLGQFGITPKHITSTKDMKDFDGVLLAPGRHPLDPEFWFNKNNPILGASRKPWFSSGPKTVDPKSVSDAVRNAARRVTVIDGKVVPFATQGGGRFGFMRPGGNRRAEAFIQEQLRSMPKHQRKGVTRFTVGDDAGTQMLLDADQAAAGTRGLGRLLRDTQTMDAIAAGIRGQLPTQQILLRSMPGVAGAATIGHDLLT
jgi:hypothetical protein